MDRKILEEQICGCFRGEPTMHYAYIMTEEPDKAD